MSKQGDRPLWVQNLKLIATDRLVISSKTTGIFGASYGVIDKSRILGQPGISFEMVYYYIVDVSVCVGMCVNKR